MNFIKNKGELLKNIPPIFAERRRILLAIAEYVLQEIQSTKLLPKTFHKSTLQFFERIAIVGIGKGATSMVDTVLQRLPRKPNFVLLANQGHPLPTREGFAQTKKIISLARSLNEKDLAIVLLSGGGSAMLTAPVPEITLQDKIKTTKVLLKSGATIQEINIVRKHLSQVKGGNLAALLYPVRVLGLVISDVIGNDVSTIASGPLSPDPSTFADAIRILQKYRIKSPPRVLKYLEIGIKNPKLETPKSGEKYFEKVSLKIIADHFTVLRKAKEQADKIGLRVQSMNQLIKGEAREVAKKFVKSTQATDKRTVFIAAGETTVTCRGKGFGGRNQEFVLSGLKYLQPNQILLSLGTDGVDGICPASIAGAIGDSAILASAQKQKLNIEKFLRNNDSYTFFKKTNGLIKTGPTRTNLGDLVLLLNR